MLYVFHVDTGTMLTLDMGLAMESVSTLQEAVGQECRIPAKQQVLLISGGETLEGDKRVCSYSAGTDTNPIFLFSKSSIESSTPPSASVNYGSESDFKEQVDGSIAMPATYETVVARAQLALQFHDVAKEELRACERLVHDQHLQHQGWAAVVANLEDITSAFHQRAQLFTNSISKFLGERQEYSDLIVSFPTTIDLLAKVPLLPCLGSLTTSACSNVEGQVSLLTWINAQDARGSLDSMLHQCNSSLQEFTEDLVIKLSGERDDLIKVINNPAMKEVKGLEERLYGLEQLLYGARKLVQDQADMAQGFVQNQNRASNLRDKSILPDLCASHQQQMMVLLKNHTSLCDIRRRCTTAKQELAANLHARLKWVMYVEKSIYDLNSKLVSHHEKLKSLRRRLEIIRQIVEAPEVYASAICEVVRRKQFSKPFLQWAENLSKECLAVRSDEVSKRSQFISKLRNHFLKSLFPGIDDVPSDYATEKPKVFDDKLPSISTDDIEFLRKEVPELSEKLVIPSPLSLELDAGSVRDAMANAGVLSFVHDSEMATSEEIEVLNQEEQETTDKTMAAPCSPKLFSGVSSSNLTPVIADGGSESNTSSQNPTQDSISPLQLPGLVPKASSGVQEKIGDEDGENAKKISSEPNSEISRSVEMVSKEEGDSYQRDDDKTDEEDTSEFLSLNAGMISASPVGASPDMTFDLPLSSKKDEATDYYSDNAKSPDFATADFFIEDSLPSAMSSPETKKLIELQNIILEKDGLLQSQEDRLGENEDEIDSLRRHLQKAKDSFKLLHNTAEKGALQLRCDVLSMEKQYVKDRDDLYEYMESVTKNLVSVIEKFEEREQQVNEELVAKMKEEQETICNDLLHKLEIESSKLQDAQNEASSYQTKLAEATELHEHFEIESEKRIFELTEEKRAEVAEVRKNLILEHEVELDKFREDLQRELNLRNQEISNLQESFKSLSEKHEAIEVEQQMEIARLHTEFNQKHTEVTQQSQREFEEKRSYLEKELRDALISAHSGEINKLKEENERKLKELKEDLTLQGEAALEKLKYDLEAKQEKEWLKEVERLSREHATDLEKLESQLTAKHESQLKDIRLEHEKIIAGFEESEGKTKHEYQMEVQNLRKSHEEQIKESNMEKAEEISKYILLEEHGRIISEIKLEYEQRQNDAERKLREELEKNFNDEKDEIVERVKKERRDSLTAMKTSVIAEKQVVFNEAMNRVVSEKDSIIASLKEENEKLLQKVQTYKDLQAEYIVETPKELANAGDVATEKNQIPQGGSTSGMTQSVVVMPMGSQSIMGASVMGQSVSGTFYSASPPSSGLEETIQELKRNLRAKEDELGAIQRKMLNLSMSASSRRIVQDKVSITTCNVSDIVLLCLDERHDHYVVFNMGSTLHFLHSDCLPTLGLKTAPGENRKSWVLAEITDKEYCQAKKAHNRFKVPMGTKFYRVKAKPWDRDAALKRDSSAPSPSTLPASPQQGQDERNILAASPPDSLTDSIPPPFYSSTSVEEQEEAK